MKHDRILTARAIRAPELRLISLLRHWHAGEEMQEHAWRRLSHAIGTERARFCLRGLEELMALIGRHGWHAPLILAPEAQSVSEDERAIAQFVLSATEQDREQALAEATMLVTPMALLPLVAAAERAGLPLLCEECRRRLRRSVHH